MYSRQEQSPQGKPSWVNRLRRDFPTLTSVAISVTLLPYSFTHAWWYKENDGLATLLGHICSCILRIGESDERTILQKLPPRPGTKHFLFLTTSVIKIHSPCLSHPAYPSAPSHGTGVWLVVEDSIWRWPWSSLWTTFFQVSRSSQEDVYQRRLLRKQILTLSRKRLWLPKELLRHSWEKGSPNWGKLCKFCPEIRMSQSAHLQAQQAPHSSVTTPAPRSDSLLSP